MSKKQVLSCLQPTGNLHIGRYFGAVQNWVNLQQSYDCIYGVVDYHAMTMPYNPKKLREVSWDIAFKLMACGIKSENIFIQSMIPEHAELAWILNCITPFGELGRMTQFKDKSSQVEDQSKDAFISAGLYTYPVLQAADIIIYHAHYVPVGKDQEQHLELTRNIANRFNNIVGKEYFPIPEPLFTKTAKIMSTAEPKKKMSASMGDKHNIDVFASPERITKQIKSAVTDSGEDTGEMSAGISNLFQILEATGEKSAYDDQMSKFESGSMRYGDFKSIVAEALVEFTNPIRNKYQEMQADKKAFKSELKYKVVGIRDKARKTLSEVKDLTGLMQTKF
jgi:tryptophanyl-tRNA synthetase